MTKDTATPTDRYAPFPEGLAALAHAGEDRITAELSRDALTELYLPDVLRQFHLLAIPLLRAVNVLTMPGLDERVDAALRAQLDKEIDVLVGNVNARVEQAQATADARVRTVLLSARRSAAWGRSQ